MRIRRTIVVRLRYKTLKTLQKNFPPLDKDESAASYFERLSQFIEQINADIAKELQLENGTR